MIFSQYLCIFDAIFHCLKRRKCLKVNNCNFNRRNTKKMGKIRTWEVRKCNHYIGSLPSFCNIYAQPEFGQTDTKHHDHLTRIASTGSLNFFYQKLRFSKFQHILIWMLPIFTARWSPTSHIASTDFKLEGGGEAMKIIWKIYQATR